MELSTFTVEWQHVKEVVSGKANLKDFYLKTDPLTVILLYALITMLITLIACHTGKKNDYTFLDPFWPTIPTIVIVHLMIHGYFNNRFSTRFLLLFPILVVWHYHLEDLFIRRGGLAGIEDHRWGYVKRNLGYDRLRLILLTVFFVSFFQSGLLVVIAIPAVKLYYSFDLPLSIPDFVFAGLMSASLVCEFRIDSVMQNFQNAKRIYKRDSIITPGYSKKELERGFCTRGIYAYSRRPNHLAEQLIWICLYLWGAYISGQWINWTIMAPVIFSLFILQSSLFTDAISQERYPDFRRYRETVSLWIPSRSAWVEEKEI
ncbi:uncharacterized protein V1516DRAFT_675570 [Lipomyces oligophaga]|uniref:uncharacterized protein n=1 Tax=Lipomyces oligophaga TaxID=45792 RepID=UPI0034CEA1B2